MFHKLFGVRILVHKNCINKLFFIIFNVFLFQNTFLYLDYQRIFLNMYIFFLYIKQRFYT